MAATGTTFLRGKVYYRAEIRENGHVIAALKGKYNHKDALDRFLRGYWPGGFSSHLVREYEISLNLKVWQYLGPIHHKVLMDVTIPRPFYVNFV